ncbi:hypothetical protein ACFLYO_01150 [Chloroflexota bacterium]
MHAPHNISAVIMLGNNQNTPQEQLVLQTQQATALDLITILQTQDIKPIIVATPDASWLPPTLDIIVDEDVPTQPFVFGPRLGELITKYQLETVMYFGGGSTPLVDEEIITLLTGMLGRAGPGSSIPTYMALTNNVHSSDWLVLTHAQAAVEHNIFEQAVRDNTLAWLLKDSGLYDVRAITRMRPAASFDLDTPADLAIIMQHPDITPRLAQILSQHNDVLSAIPVPEILKIATTPQSNLTLIGRVSPQAWQALNKATQCWIRVFAEERGMVASGRLHRAEVQSLLGELLRTTGPTQFFATLANMTDAAIIDSRPLMASQGHWPTNADRFASDLYQIGQIKNEWLREFTIAARAAPIPILLGGHSVVAGGLFTLIEIINARLQQDP